MMMKTNPASIPGVDKILTYAGTEDLITRYGRPLVTGETRNVLQEIRADALRGGLIPMMDEIVDRISVRLIEFAQFTIKPVINATGVILHTNLGRAPFSKNAIEAMKEAAQNYSTLEFDLKSGTRSKRTIHLESLFAQLFGGEDSLVVNNNAAAILLILSALANKKKVVISRGQIVEIGGGFRIPDILKLSGAQLVEIGTTNQVHSEDYEKAITDGGDLILVVHPSNYRIKGYSSEPSLEEIVAIAHKHGVPIVEDLGSGALLDTAEFGLAHEPTVQESLKAGVDLVCFSGDKLLGGPQAGCILGKSTYLNKIKKHPLARVVRADKLLISSLEATLQSYLFNRPLDDIPVWKMISAELDGIRNRAETWMHELGDGSLMEGRSTIGGGSMPEEEMPTWLMALRVEKPDILMKILREQDPAVIARIQDGLVCFDPRTVLPEQDTILVSSISSSLQLYREKNHEKTNR
jgi:L-seryl-tRNA(Ser) seleniumtransferase